MCNQSNLADTKLGIRILGEISAYPSLRHSDFEGPRHSLPRNETAAELIQLSMEDAVPIQCTRIDGSIHHSPTAQLSRLYVPTVLITHKHTHTHAHTPIRPTNVAAAHPNESAWQIQSKRFHLLRHPLPAQGLLVRHSVASCQLSAYLACLLG